MYEPLSRCDIAVETPTSVNKNVSIGMATSPGPIVEVAGRTGQKPPASSTKQRKKHTSAPPQAWHDRARHQARTRGRFNAQPADTRRWLEPPESPMRLIRW